MKHLTLFLSAILSASFAIGQVQNPGFESWTQQPTYNHPVDETVTFFSSNDELFYTLGLTSTVEVPGTEGSAMRIETIEADGEPAGGFAVWGFPPEGEGMEFTGGFPFTDGMVTTLSADLRYSVNEASPAIVVVQFKFEGELVGPGNLDVGTYVFTISGEQETFSTSTFDILPAIGTEVDECIIALASNNLLADEAMAFVGDFVEIDNLSFDSTQEIPGGDFNTWTAVNPITTPDDWFVQASPFLVTFEQSTDAFEGDYALKLTSFENDEFVETSIAIQGEATDEGLVPSIATGSDFSGFSFAYKYLPNGEDQGVCFIALSEELNPAPEDIVYQVYPLSEQLEYTTYNVDLTDIGQLLDMNYMSIVFASSFDDGEVFPQVGSTLYVDDIQLDNGGGDPCDFEVFIDQGNDLILCPEGSAILSVSDSYDSYQWFQQPMFGGGEPMAIDGATDPSLEIDTDLAVFNVWCEITLGECVVTSNEIGIDMYVFVPTTVISTDNQLCEGETTTLTANGAQGSVEWFWNGELIEGETGQDLVVSESGEYTCAISPDLCPDLSFNSGVGPTITVNPLPEPVIEVFQNELSTGMFESYQWFLYGEAIDGATEQDYTADETGDYSVEVVDIFGCSNGSEEVQIIISGISDIILSDLVIYPNPVANSLKVSGGSAQQYEVLDLMGRIVQTGFVTRNGQIDTSTLAEGAYVLNLLIDGVQRTFLKK